MTAFAGGLTQYDLAELLVNKAQAEYRIEIKNYTTEEMVDFVENYNLYTITDVAAEVSINDVRQALAIYDAEKGNIVLSQSETAELGEDKTVVEKMLENALASNMVSPISKSEIQKLADAEVVFCKPGCYMENGTMIVNDSIGLEDALSDIVDVARVLQVHAAVNDQKIAIAGGGTGIVVMYGENREQLRRDAYMFKMGYLRDAEWANQEEINGQMYTFDKQVTVDMLLDIARLEDNMKVIADIDAYCDEQIDMEEDVLIAFYDGLRTLDKSRAEALFEKMTDDYIHSKTNDYGDPNNPATEFFEIDGQLIYKEEIKGNTGFHRYITYKFIK